METEKEDKEIERESGCISERENEKVYYKIYMVTIYITNTKAYLIWPFVSSRD